MDVGCPKCHTEYELEDARVPDEGVTVKCTTCAHVFRVKRRAAAVTLSVGPDDLGQALTELPPPASPRVWKVRQPGGAVLICRELTALQKWIVEARVSRDDEISLTGEVWKRLGDIPELASFFQVVDQASRVRAYESLHGAPLPPPPASSPSGATEPAFAGSASGLYTSLPTPAGPVFASSASGLRPGVGDSKGPAFTSSRSAMHPALSAPSGPAFTSSPSGPKLPDALGASGPTGVPQGAAAQPGPTGLPTAPATPPSARETLRGPNFSVPLPAPRPPGLVPTSVRSGIRDAQLRRARTAGGEEPGRGWVLVVAGFALLGVAGWYYGIHRPLHLGLESPWRTYGPAAAEPTLEPLPALPVDAGPVASPTVPRAAPAPAPAPALAPAPAPAPAAAAPVEVVDAGEAALALAALPGPPADPASTPPPATSPRPPARASYDALLERADALREHEKVEAALDLYGRAHELKPDRVEPLTGRGLCLLDLGQPVVAEAAFEQALQLDDRYGPAIMGLAEASRIQGHNARALEYYQRYLDVLPDGAEAPVARNNLERLKK
jgi:predicted Zn finger-like uncharacterized protein